MTDWTLRIACADVDPDIFYPTGTSREYANWAPARAVCARCPVIRECRDATDRIEAERPVSEVDGMFAGETPKERKARRKRSRAWADRALPPVERDLAMMRRAILRGEMDVIDERMRA